MNRQIEDMHLQQKKLCAGLEVFLLQPRLNRIKYFGLFLFWITIIMSGAVVMHALSYFLLPGFLRTLVVLFILFGLVFR